MCPACIVSAAVMAAGAGSTGGILAVCIGKFRNFFRTNGLACFRKSRRNKMATSKEREVKNQRGHLAMKTQPIVSPQQWEAARQQLLVKEKAFTRSRDARPAERRRIPWLALASTNEFEGPKGKATRLE